MNTVSERLSEIKAKINEAEKKKQEGNLILLNFLRFLNFILKKP